MSSAETNLVPNAGLLPVAELAQRIGLGDLVDQRLRLAAEDANSGAKALAVIGSMLAGGDGIDDTGLLCAGAAGELFDDTRAPSTVGCRLRTPKWSNVRELGAVSRESLARLWAAGAGPADPGGPLTIYLDSSMFRSTAAGSRVPLSGKPRCGYHSQFATLRQDGNGAVRSAPPCAAGAARGAKGFLTETVSRVHGARATGQLTVRSDSAFYAGLCSAWR